MGRWIEETTCSKCGGIAKRHSRQNTLACGLGEIALGVIVAAIYSGYWGILFILVGLGLLISSIRTRKFKCTKCKARFLD